MRRILTITVIVLALLVFASMVALRSYLRSNRVNQDVVGQLEGIYGGPVRVAEVEVGLGSTTIRGVELFERGSDGKEAWLKVASVDMDASLLDLARGNVRPKQITLHGVAASLRFDQAGNLLTSLPVAPGTSDTSLADAFAAVVIDEGEITFRKEGCEDLTVKNVNGRIDNQAGRFVITGSGESAEAGKLLVDGSLEKDSPLAIVHIKSAAKAHISQALLNRLPFVPVETWEWGQIAEADASAVFTVRYDMKTHALHYRAELAAENTKFVVPALDLAVHGARGAVVIEDNLVRLRDFSGETYGGTIRAEGTLDIRGAAKKLTFTKMTVANLNVSELPEDWNIPAVVRKSIAEGKLFGDATLEVTIHPSPSLAVFAVTLIGAAGTPGESFAGIGMMGASLTPTVTAKSQGKGQVRDPHGKSEPIEFEWQLAPRRSRPGNPPEKTSQAPIRVEQLLASLFVNQTTLIFQAPKDKPQGSPNYLDLNFNLKNASLADAIKNQNVDLPFPIDGKVSLQIKASIPIDRINNFKAYKAQGAVQLTQLSVAGMKIEEVNADVKYADGTLYLTALKANIADGTRKDVTGIMKGTGQIQIAPLGDLRFDLSLDRVSASALVDVPSDKVQGTFSGKLSLRGQADKLQSVKSLQGDGTIHSDRLMIYGLVLEQISAAVRLRDGIVKLDELKSRLEGTPIAASGELNLSDYAFLAKLDIRDWGLASLEKLAFTDRIALPALDGAFTTNVILQGKLKPLEFKASGDAKTQDLKVNGLATNTVRFHWETDGKKIDVSALDALLYDGKVTGTAVLPFDPKAEGKLDLRIQSINAKQLTKDLHIPFTAEGNVDGMVNGMLPPVQANKTRTAVLHVDLKAPKLRVQNIPTEQLHGTVEYRQGMLDYKLEGKTLGGTFDLVGQVPVAPGPQDLKKVPLKKGRLSIQNVQMANLFKALNVGNAESLKGRLNLEVNYTHETPDRFPEGQGTLRISNVRWNDTRLSDDLQGDVILSEQQIRVRGLEGDLAQGTLTARLTYDLRQPERSSFAVNLERVESGQLLAPWLDKKIAGPIQARIRGNLGRTWRGSADVEMASGKVFGLDVAQWRLPVVWRFAPSQGRGQIEIHETSAQVTRGRATGKMTLAWEHSARVEGQLRLERVELQDLLRQTIGPSQIGGGQTTARFDFAGKDVRSLNDIGGNLVASFHQAQALQVPVLNQIAPHLGVGPSTTFQKGDLRARLDRGSLRIQQMKLEGNNARVHLEGSVALDGRLNLNVVARSGDIGLPPVRLGPIALRIPVAGPVPLVLLQEASGLLSNHVAYLQVTGTAHSPVIRARPVAVLSEEAVRYFLNRSLPISIEP